MVRNLGRCLDAGDQMVVISIEGSLFFAGSQTLKEKLPKVGDAKNPVVVLRMRNQSQMGATLIDILDDYADELKEAGGKLSLTGLDDDQIKYLRGSGKLVEKEDVELFREMPILGESTRAAVAHANEWVIDRKEPRMRQ
ncbi:STAS domain-containing protein [Atopococcus tabaci]|uniref:STAS domain-containing protein n=1 Tax=Atopococcus tabaci TaxID=269774 RepID=UPI00047F3A72|nr:sodium-independent anion transporter [Atopococcus tabaci]